MYKVFNLFDKYQDFIVHEIMTT